MAQRAVFLIAFSLMLMGAAAKGQQTAPAASLAATRMNELGPENSRMAERSGIWEVTESSWASPGATPTVTKLMAERRMVGPFLEEVIEPTLHAAALDIKRIDYLSFNRVEGRWKYLSMDTRVPAGMMPAASYGRNEDGSIRLIFDPFALAGPGGEVAGQMVRMEQMIVRVDADHDRKDQFFTFADGNGTRWLGHQYVYARRKP